MKGQSPKKGFTLWFTGLPSSGKSTLADAVAEELKKKGMLTERLDGDLFRQTISKDLGFTPEDIKKNIEEKIEALKKAKEGSDVNAIRTASEDLSREMQKIGEILYKQGQEPKDNNIKDADFKEEDGGDNKS